MGDVERQWRLGEAAAERYLIRRGWRILARNWRTRGGEIDIVARRRGVVLAVEVKARSGPGELDEVLREDQRDRIVRTFEAYLARHPHLDGDRVRLMLVAVDLERRRPRVQLTADVDASP